ncbi:MAG: ribonuclease HII [Peptostreptococcales bacterium]
MEIKKLSVKELKKIIEKLDKEKYIEFAEKLNKDSRNTVKEMAQQLYSHYNKYKIEYSRIEKMKEFEERLYEKGVSLIAGIDEVGRGPLAGPVVTAAVVLPKDFFVLGINDSKKLTERKREELYALITEKAIDIGIGIVDNRAIDEMNILNATKLAMKVAVERLKRKPEHLLIDALVLGELDIEQTGIVKGDEKSVSIAAASIVAKVTRDRMMVNYHKKYPFYNFQSNKGYGTREHYEGLESNGPCEIHRKSFLKNLLEEQSI